MSFCWVNLNIIFSSFIVHFFRFRSSPFAIKLFFIFNLIFSSFATSFFSFSTSFFFIFLCFWWFSIVFHWFSWLSWISGATGKENEKKWSLKWKKHDKKMKISSSFWRFPGSEWESATLNPNFHFFHFQLHLFFHFPLFLMLFHCFSLIFMVFLDFRCPGQGKWNKMKKMIN